MAKRDRKRSSETVEERRKAILEQLGGQIRERRGDRTVTWLADRFADVGARSRWLDYKGVWALENGKAAIGLEDLQVIADAFGDPLDVYVAALLPGGLSISPEEAHERIRLAYRGFLERAAARVEREVSQTMDAPAFRQMVGWLAELSQRRRQQVRDHIRGLRKLEGEERFASRVPTTTTAPVGESLRIVDKALPGSVVRRSTGSAVEPTEPVGTRSEVSADVDWSMEAKKLRRAAEFAEKQARITSHTKTSGGGSKQR